MESQAITNTGIALGGGAVLGLVGAAARNDNQFGSAALVGASAGAGLAILGGLIVALVSKDDREVALETAGLGLVGSLVLGIMGAR